VKISETLGGAPGKNGGTWRPAMQLETALFVAIERKNCCTGIVLGKAL